MEASKYFIDFKQELLSASETDLITLFNTEVGLNGWGTARASFLAALHDEFVARKIDISLIGDAKSLSFKSKIKLEENKIYKI